jgi:hypothetical protein
MPYGRDGSFVHDDTGEGVAAEADSDKKRGEAGKPIEKRPELDGILWKWVNTPGDDEERFKAWVGGDDCGAILKFPLKHTMPVPDIFHTELYEGWNPTNPEHDAFTKFYFEKKKDLSVEEFKTIFPVTKEWFVEYRKKGLEEFYVAQAKWDEEYIVVDGVARPRGEGEKQVAVAG